MPTVTVNSQPYEVYADVVEADLYLQANFLASSWFDQTQDVRAQLLVTSTRLLDRQCWLGAPTGVSGQVLQWPRTGLDGVDETTVPDNIVNASIELAFSILDGNDVVNSSVPNAQKLDRIGAGSVNLSWFRGAEGPIAQNGRFPLPVYELVKAYACSTQQIDGIGVSGTGGVSVTEDDLGFNEGV